MAVDNAGDFLVTWTNTGSYTDAAGATYPVTNIEARYYTDTVDQVNLPTSLLTTTGTSQPYFSLKYNDQTIEQISVSGEAQSPSGAPTGTSIRAPSSCFSTQPATTFRASKIPTVGGGTRSDLLTVNYNESPGTTPTAWRLPGRQSPRSRSRRG